ncbi:MAG: hypothetical protein KY475_23825 [Planctomycetes bacterium]|nr:hypothetical protein [Planctomycetota bacterium]
MEEHPFSEPPNPYAAPDADVRGAGAAWATPLVVQALSQTRPWVLFLSILGFLVSGLMIVGGVFGGGAAAMGQMGPMGTMEAVIFVLYVLFGVLYMVPSFFLLRYGQLISQFARDPTSQRLAEALKAQRSFWRFAGIMTAIVFALYCLAIPLWMGFVGFAIAMQP